MFVLELCSLYLLFGDSLINLLGVLYDRITGFCEGIDKNDARP